MSFILKTMKAIDFYCHSIFYSIYPIFFLYNIILKGASLLCVSTLLTIVQIGPSLYIWRTHSNPSTSVINANESKFCFEANANRSFEASISEFFRKSVKP